jgi:hypothetical protein
MLQIKAKAELLIQIVILLLIISFFSCKRNKIETKNGEYFYEWSELPYHNLSEKSIIESLSTPIEYKYLKLHRKDFETLSPLYRPLVRFIPSDKNEITIKELIWKQDSFLIYYWFIQKKSIWYSVDGLMYDPNHVQF